MKKLLTLLLAMTLVLSGCNTQSAGSTPESTPAPEPSSANETAKSQLTDAQRERYTQALDQLRSKGALMTNWNGTPIGSDLSGGTYAIVDAAPAENGLVSVTAELYYEIYLDTGTMQESLSWGDVSILTEGLPYSPSVAIGKSIIELRDNPGGEVEVVSCSYQPYPSPGINYLKEQAAKNPTPADSPKLDTTKYDPHFAGFIWKQLLKKRFVASPGDITLADLEAMTGQLDIDWSALPPEADGQNFLMDASLLRLMPNLTSVNCMIDLKDYSVFDGMNKLTALRLSNMNDERMATLRVGHTDMLYLDTPDCQLLDLSNINTEGLTLYSWSTGIGAFAGCERIENLYVYATRTDTKLLNAENFPNAEYLNLAFYSDYKRVRDLANLATFDGKTTIDLLLGDLACNDETVATLAEVPLRLLMLTPRGGLFPADTLLAPIKAGQLLKGGDIEFSLRTKDS